MAHIIHLHINMKIDNKIKINIQSVIQQYGLRIRFLVIRLIIYYK
jgi:antitoxin component of RelBE/YafQ-DinJ toxin-antitoxin module